jgi:hypothetical protein
MKNLSSTILSFMMLLIAFVFSLAPAYAMNEGCDTCENCTPCMEKGAADDIFLIAQAPAMNPTTAIPQAPTVYLPDMRPGMNIIDYGLVGVVTLGVMGLLTYMVKSEKADRREMMKSIDRLSTTNEGLRESTERLRGDINNVHTNIESRFSAMDNSMRRLEDAVNRK